jgi:GDP-D-mannose 3',5'-epimerase
VKTVVTGGNGFICSHLVKKLLSEGRDVIVADITPRHKDDKLAGLGIKVGDIEFRHVELRDYTQAKKALKSAESVYHMAARVGSLQYLHASESVELTTMQNNLVIDANVFNSCIKNNVQSIVYASSVAIYDMARQYGPNAVYSEDEFFVRPGLPYPTINPDGGYGWAKLMGEVELNWMKTIKIGIARIFNIYGINEPIDEKAHAIGDLMRRAILNPGGDYIVFGDGKQTRDYLHVTDCAAALVKLEAKASLTPITVNIGSGHATSIRTIADTVVGVSGKKFNMIFDTTKPVGPISRTADISKAKKLLDWHPKVSLNEGLKETYGWIKGKLT